MKQTKIAIIGFGYVGKAMVKFFRHGTNEVWAYDSAATIDASCGYTPGYAPSLSYLNDLEIDVAVICVPTKMDDDGSCDTSIVEKVVDEIDVPLIIIKSTVTPGTTDRLKKKTGKHIVFSPEYAGESSYWTPYKFHTDVVEMPFFIFGGAPEDTSYVVDLYAPIAGPTKIYRQTTSMAAEMAKYMENTFYATKITFCYEMKNICDAAGIDYNEARELWLLDPRLSPMHTSVFEKNDTPFAGKCFPKDLNGLISFAKKMGYDPKLLEEVCDSNSRIGKFRAKKRKKTK